MRKAGNYHVLQTLNAQNYFQKVLLDSPPFSLWPPKQKVEGQVWNKAQLLNCQKTWEATCGWTHSGCAERRGRRWLRPKEMDHGHLSTGAGMWLCFGWLPEGPLLRGLGGACARDGSLRFSLVKVPVKYSGNLQVCNTLVLSKMSKISCDFENGFNFIVVQFVIPVWQNDGVYSPSWNC